MECRDVRKKLKEYAEGSIHDPLDIEHMEAHIVSCPVCMKELELWQDVIDRRQKINNMNFEPDFAARIRQRNRKMSRNINLPPMARRFMAAQQMMSTGMGCLIMQVLLLTLFIGFLYLFTDKLDNPVVVILVGIGGFSMIFLLVREMIKKKKNRR